MENERYDWVPSYLSSFIFFNRVVGRSVVRLEAFLFLVLFRLFGRLTWYTALVGAYAVDVNMHIAWCLRKSHSICGGEFFCFEKLMMARNIAVYYFRSGILSILND